MRVHMYSSAPIELERSAFDRHWHANTRMHEIHGSATRWLQNEGLELVGAN
jgi:hypothetical protein